MHAFAVFTPALPYASIKPAIEAVKQLVSLIADGDPTPVLWATFVIIVIIVIVFLIRLVTRVTNTLLRAFTRMLDALIRMVDALIRAQHLPQYPVEPQNEPMTTTKPSRPMGRRQPKRGKRLRQVLRWLGMLA